MTISISQLEKSDGSVEILYKAEDYRLAAGEVMVMETGGGGGYGDPRERPVADVQRDLLRGYISRTAAKRDYAVTVNERGEVSR